MSNNKHECNAWNKHMQVNMGARNMHWQFTCQSTSRHRDVNVRGHVWGLKCEAMRQMQHAIPPLFLGLTVF